MLRCSDLIKAPHARLFKLLGSDNFLHVGPGLVPAILERVGWASRLHSAKRYKLHENSPYADRAKAVHVAGHGQRLSEILVRAPDQKRIDGTEHSSLF